MPGLPPVTPCWPLSFRHWCEHMNATLSSNITVQDRSVSLLVLVRPRWKETISKVVCNAFGLDWEQVKMSNKCSETSRIASVVLPDHRGLPEGLRAVDCHTAFSRDPVLTPQSVQPALNTSKELLLLFFASIKYFSYF